MILGVCRLSVKRKDTCLLDSSLVQKHERDGHVLVLTHGEEWTVHGGVHCLAQDTYETYLLHNWLGCFFWFQGHCLVRSDSHSTYSSLMAPSLFPTALSLSQLCSGHYVFRCLISDAHPGVGVACVRCDCSLTTVLRAYKAFDRLSK